jgi:hypothetical protein
MGGLGGVRGRSDVYDDARELFEQREPSADFSASEMYSISHTDTITNSTSVLTDDASVSVALIDKKVKRLGKLFKSAGNAMIDSMKLVAKEKKEADPDALSIRSPLVLDEDMCMAVQKKEVCMYACCMPACMPICMPACMFVTPHSHPIVHGPGFFIHSAQTEQL